MSKFGKYAIVENSRYSFKKEPELWWEFKPVTAGDELSLTSFIAKGREETVNDEKVPMPRFNQEIAFREVALSFGGTNIPEKEGTDKPILKPGASIDQIEAVLKEMPSDMFLELWEALGDVFPLWGKGKPKEDGQEEA